MIASVGVNELILRTLRSAHQIEASDRAYFAAEAGIEDALYELTPHFAGYETPDRPVGLPADTDTMRRSVFDSGFGWENRWEIKSISNADEFSGYVFPSQKLIISLYNDNSVSSSTNADVINTNGPDINTIRPASFQITFKVPYDKDDEYSDTFVTDELVINNDSDNDINEDGPKEDGNCYLTSPSDADCDGREDEDSDQDPVIYWKITDDEGNFLEPITGCFLGDPADQLDPEGTEICEKDFEYVSGEYLQKTLTNTDEGIDQDGTQMPIGDFIAGRSNNTKLQIEFQIIAPLVQSYEDQSEVRGIIIPYLDYTVEALGTTDIPLPQFTIKSDGYYKDFKQAITTTITPKTIVPLFDFTIIQQQ